MNYQLKEWPLSNYQIALEVPWDVLADAKTKVLKTYSKDIAIPWFRKGHAPQAEVEKQMRPDYLQMAVYEEVMSGHLRKLVEDEKEKQFIGSPYDINFDEKDGTTTITYTLDTYPVVAVKNDSWKKASLKPVDENVTQEQIDEAVYNFKKQYADYEDADAIAEGTVTRVNYDILDKTWEKFDSSFLFVWDEETKEHPLLKDLFRGKKKDDTFDAPYSEKKLPKILFYTKDKGTPHSMSFTVGEVKKIVLPEFDEKKIAELFGEDAKVKNEAEIVQMITESMKQEKTQAELMKQVEDLLLEIMKGSLSIAIPKTMIDEEVKQRMDNMKERFGWEEKFQTYLKQLGEEKQWEMVKEIADAAKQSLEKFMILRKFVELHELDVDWQKGLDAESKLYEKLTGKKVRSSEFLEKMKD